MIGQGRPAEMFGCSLVIGMKNRVELRVVANEGKPPLISASATNAEAIGDVLGLIIDLDIRIPARRAALDELRRALEQARIDPHIQTPAKAPRDGVDCGDVLDAVDCAVDTGDCLGSVVDLAPSCDGCDLPCDIPDPGCF